MGRDFPSVQTGPEAHPAPCTMGTGSFPGVKYGRGVLMTTHPLLVPWSWKSRAIPLPNPWATTGPVTVTLYLFFFLLVTNSRQWVILMLGIGHGVTAHPCKIFCAPNSRKATKLGRIRLTNNPQPVPNLKDAWSFTSCPPMHHRFPFRSHPRLTPELFITITEFHAKHYFEIPGGLWVRP